MTRFAVAALVAWCAFAPAAAPAQTPAPACPRPYVAARTIRAVAPMTPALADQWGISGTVQVIVSLDEESRVTGTRIMSSPSAVLNAAALVAARESTFQTEIRDCKPIAASYVFSVDFQAQPMRRGADGRRYVVVTGSGSVMRAPDVAKVVLRTNDRTISASVLAKLQAAGIAPRDIATTFSTKTEGDDTSVPRMYTVTVTSVSRVAEVIAAAASAGPVGLDFVRFELLDAEPAYQEALASATVSGENNARTVAQSAHVRLGKLVSAEVPPHYPTTFVSFGPVRYVAGTVPRAIAPIDPVPVRVTATVMMTYLIEP